MSRYLKHFTAVGDDQKFRLEEEEEEELQAASPELPAASGLFPTTLTFRQALQRLYSCQRFQVQTVTSAHLHIAKQKQIKLSTSEV